MWKQKLKLNIMIIYFLIINFICTHIQCTYSGVYVDNGIDQTIMERMISKDDAQEVEHEILELLGLPDRPRKKHIHVSMRKSAPKFLLNVYKRLTDEANENGNSRYTRSIDESDNLITDTDRNAIEESDIIMTFLNKHHHVPEVRHERGRRLWFDVSEVSKDSSLMMGELRIYQNPDLGKWKNVEHKDFVITVYAIINADGQRELEILTSVNTSSKYHGWLELNVTDGITKWLMNGNANKGIYIGAHSVDKPEHEVKLDDIGLVNVKGDDEYQPFMIGYFNAPTIVKPVKHKSRTKRNVQRRRKKSETRNPLYDIRQDNNNFKSCQIQTLYVSFKDLNWQDWIIAPDGYGAFYCSGECNFPLNAHMNATNHAIVQTLVHLIQPSKVPKACCAPTKLSPISVLYFLDEANVNLKKYKNMVVKSCGCH